MPRSSSDTARLFFALWPDDAVRGALDQLSRSLHAECGGRTMLVRNIHLTLVFLGNVAAARVAELRVLAATVAAPRFDLTVDTLNYWRQNRIVWAGTTVCPEALRELVARLTQVLRTARFRCEEREYVPHITLLRDARRAPAMRAAGDIAWHASDFALVQSLRRDGATVYEVIGRWSLESA